MLAFSNSKGNKALKVLEKKGMIKKIKLKTKQGRGNLSSFLEVTRDGLDALSKSHQNFKGKGGLKHAFYIHKVGLFLESHGREIKQEFKSSDIAVITPDGELQAYEVCIHVSNIRENIIRNTNNGFKTVLVFENKDVLEKVKNNMHIPNEITLKIIDEFL